MVESCAERPALALSKDAIGTMVDRHWARHYLVEHVAALGNDLQFAVARIRSLHAGKSCDVELDCRQHYRCLQHLCRRIFRPAEDDTAAADGPCHALCRVE